MFCSEYELTKISVSHLLKIMLEDGSFFEGVQTSGDNFVLFRKFGCGIYFFITLIYLDR